MVLVAAVESSGFSAEYYHALKGNVMFEENCEGERRETVDELSDLLLVVQEMGQRLANETHGDAYAPVRELNELLHQARRKIEKIKAGKGL